MGADLPDNRNLKELLAELIRRGASDLLLVGGIEASVRMNGVVEKIGDHPLAGSEIEALVLGALSPTAAEQYRSTQIADSSYRVSGLGRFRINLHRERAQAAATIRALPVKVPLLADLGLPAEVGNLAGLRRGLVLIGGAAGAGKSTTMAAIVNEINKRDARHILTIEDPVEYEHPHLRSVIEQVEVGIDAPDFPTALRAALRQAPDVLVVGEMRDPESMAIAVSAAETGHLVLSTLHRRGLRYFAHLRFVSCRAPKYDPAGTVDGDLGHSDADIVAQPQGRASSGSRDADDRIWRAAAHTPQRAPTLAPGDHDDPGQGIDHF